MLKNYQSYATMPSKPETHQSSEPSSSLSGSGRSRSRSRSRSANGSGSRRPQDEKLTAQVFIRRLQKHPVLTMVIAVAVFSSLAAYLAIKLAE